MADRGFGTSFDFVAFLMSVSGPNFLELLGSKYCVKIVVSAPIEMLHNKSLILM